jgi:hypothetical protein
MLIRPPEYIYTRINHRRNPLRDGSAACNSRLSGATALGQAAEGGGRSARLAPKNGSPPEAEGGVFRCCISFRGMGTDAILKSSADAAYAGRSVTQNTVTFEVYQGFKKLSESSQFWASLLLHYLLTIQGAGSTQILEPTAATSSPG